MTKEQEEWWEKYIAEELANMRLYLKDMQPELRKYPGPIAFEFVKNLRYKMFGVMMELMQLRRGRIDEGTEILKDILK